MPSKSEKQRRLFGLALSYKRGETKDVSDEVKKLANSMTEKQLKDYATKQEIKEMVRTAIRGEEDI